MNNTYSNTFGNYSAADALPAERASFIRKTYLHLAAAIALFVILETYIMLSGAGQMLFNTLLGTSYSWLIVMVAFMGVSWLANWWASSATSKPLQYMGLILYTVAEAIIFAPLLFFATYYSGDGTEMIGKAGIVTIGLFLGLTAVVFLTKKDFSFLGPILTIGSFIALGLIVSSIVFGFSLGSIFAFVMVAFAGGVILFNTSNVMHQYNTNQHVAASLALFAGIALLFWYILQIFMGGSDD